MNNLKSFLLNQLNNLADSYNDIEVIEDTGDSITLITSIHFDLVHITVNKGNAKTGWRKRNTTKNDYFISFKITPLNEEYINIEVFSQGIIANAMLQGTSNDGIMIWKFQNFNNTEESFYNSDYPYINFTESLNKQNQFTEFIANNICLIKDCLNNELFQYEDFTIYDNEAKDSTEDPEGDLILTIREDTWNILRKKAFIALSDGTNLIIDKSMIGKKIIRKDSNPNIFYPVDEKDFVTK